MTDFNSKKCAEQDEPGLTWGWMQDRSVALAGAEEFRMWLTYQLDVLVADHSSWITPNSLKRELAGRGVAK
jgi:hypothetical protein